MSPVISGNIDVALITLNAFVLFFIGLVIYLNRESRREGFPLEDDFGGRVHSKALIHDASPKTFKLPFVVAPARRRITRARRSTCRWRASAFPVRRCGRPATR